VKGALVSFDYVAKGGLDRVLTLKDSELARAVAGLKRVRSESERLLIYKARGVIRELHSDDLNQRFKELVGDSFAVKDLRTWNATVLAAAALAREPRPTSQRATRKSEMNVLREVSGALGNTPAVARKSYVDPRLFDYYENGVTIAPALKRVDQVNLDDPQVRVQVEKAVLELLSD
jgi:DNA topoisomerase IB